MSLRFLFSALILTLATVLYGESNPSSKTKIAIVGQSAKCELLADTVMSDISERGFVCLERTEIKKALKEQKLSARGFVNPSTIIKCSRLLKVDLFAVIFCSQKTKEPAGVIVFDARLGIRLSNDSLPRHFDNQVSFTVKAIINTISKKQQLGNNKTKLVSFLPLNIIALQGKRANSAKRTEIVLMRLLGRNKDFFLLERDQLDFLLKERTLHSNTENKLLAGSLFIQLDAGLSCQKNTPVSLKLFIKDITGKVLFSIYKSYSLDNEVQAAKYLAEQVEKKLGATVVSKKFDCNAEAAKYIEECWRSFSSGTFERTSRLARNAYALNHKYHKILISFEKEIALAYLNRARFSTEALKKAVEHTEFIFEINDNSIGTQSSIKRIMCSFSRISNYYFRKCPQLKIRVRKLRTQTVSMLLESYKQRYRQIETVNSADDMKHILKCIGVISGISRAAGNNEINIKYGMPLKKLYVANIDRFYTPSLSLAYNGFNLFAPGNKPCSVSQLVELYCAMQKTSVPYFKILGTLLLHRINLYKSKNADFIAEVIKNKQIPDRDWEPLKFLLKSHFLGENNWENEINLKWTIYKKKGYDKYILFRNNTNSKKDALGVCSFMNKIIADVKDSKTLTGYNKSKIINEINSYINTVKKRHSISVPQIQSQKNDNTPVFRRCFSILPKDLRSRLSQPLYDGNNIYVARIKRKKFLYKISPKQGFSYKAGKGLTLKNELVDLWQNSFFACLSKKYYIIAVSGGMFIFPLDLSTPEFIPLKEFKGLDCYSVTYMKEKVYISYDNKRFDSEARRCPLFLVEYDLLKKTYSIVFSSSQSCNNPFSKGKLCQFRQIYADTIRNRLIFPVSKKGTAIELWSLDPISRNFTKLISLPYYSGVYGPQYSPFIVSKNKNCLFIMAKNVVYEFDTLKNEYKLRFYSNPNLNYIHPPVDNALVKPYSNWRRLRPSSTPSDIRPVYFDGTKLWTRYRLIFQHQKKAINLVGKFGNDSLCYVYYPLNFGNFVIGRSYNTSSLLAMELKSDSELLKLPECEDITPHKNFFKTKYSHLVSRRKKRLK